MTIKRPSLKPTSKDTGYAWVIVVSAFFLQAIQDGVRFSYGLFFVEFLTEFRQTKADTAWVGSIMLSVFNLGGPASAFIVNKLGFRIGTMIGSVITAIGFVLSYFASNLYLLYFSYGALQGFGFGLVFLSGYVATAKYFKKRRALAVGITFCGGGIGTFALLPLARLIIDTYNWRGAMFILAGVTLNECVCAALLRPFIEDESRMDEEKKDSIEEERNISTKPGSSSKIQDKDTEMQSVPLLALADNREIDNESTSIKGDTKKEYDMSVTKENRDCLTKCNVARSLQDISSGKKCLTGTKSKDCVLSKSLNSLLMTNHTGENMVSFKSNNEPRVTDVSSNDEMTRHENNQSLSVTDGNKQPSSNAERRFKNTFIEDLCPKELVTNMNFIIFMLSTVFIAIPEFVPYSMLPDFALNVNCSSEESAWTLSVVGIGATIGQLIAGWLADLDSVHNLSLLGGCILSVGLITMIIAVIPMFETFITYAALYGMFSGAMYSVQPIVLLEYIDEKYMASMHGLTMWVYGISGLIGTPAAGWLFDTTGNYAVSFLSAGACFIISGIINFFVLCTKRSRNARQQEIACTF